MSKFGDVIDTLAREHDEARAEVVRRQAQVKRSELGELALAYADAQLALINNTSPGDDERLYAIKTDALISYATARDAAKRAPTLGELAREADAKYSAWQDDPANDDKPALRDAAQQADLAYIAARDAAKGAA